MLGTTIKSLVDAGPASVRLRNSIERAVTEENMPLETVGQYLAAGLTARARFMNSVWAFGRRTANELDALVNAFVARSDIDLDDVDGPAPQDHLADLLSVRLDEMATRLEGLTYADAIHGQLPSVRLENGLTAGALLETPITDLIFRGTAARNGLLNTPNFGRKSLGELEELVQAAAIRALARDCTDPAQLVDDCALLFRVADSQKQALAQQILATLTGGPPCQNDFRALIDWAMPELGEREVAIIRRAAASRLGFNGSSTGAPTPLGDAQGTRGEDSGKPPG